ncbi:DUF3558 domain-containing protein [Pleionea sediminis]|uniref:DUF3558 domain-containing protein n=1 Tax=Pleionea sediminis TaxID=2569479 RepID=UPI0011864717|nr:DUF3558 domain-containing protein [Pleionea sediminis]
MIQRNTALWFFALVFLFGCEDDSSQSNTTTPVPKENTQKPQTVKNTEIEAPTIALQKIPETIDLDPCQLLTESELNEIGLPTDQYVAQQGFSRQLPNHSPITPFIGCKWRSVDQATPFGLVQIQQVKGEFTPEVEEEFGLGEVSWKATYQGRDQLIVKTGDRLVMVTTQIPYNDKSTMEANVWIAKKVLGRLEKIAANSNVQSANASLVGGPNLDVCEASIATKPYELFQGKFAWAIPNIEINQVPSENKRPQEDSVSCMFNDERRGKFYAYYLGKDGLKRWQQHFEKNGEKISLNGQDAFKDRRKLFIPLEQGGIMVDVQSIRYFSDEEIDKKISDTAMAILSKIK